LPFSCKKRKEFIEGDDKDDYNNENEDDSN